MRQTGLDVMLYLVRLSVKVTIIKAVSGSASTFVTAVPPRKKTTSRAKKTLQGWIACTTAVMVAASIPAGVRELLVHARSTRIATAGTAMYGCIAVYGISVYGV